MLTRFFLVVCLFVASVPAHAETFVWTGSGPNQRLSTNQNWEGAQAPANTGADILQFPAEAVDDVLATAAVPWSVRGIVISGPQNAADIELDGSELTVGADGIAGEWLIDTRIHNDVRLGTTQTWSHTTTYGTVDLNNSALYLDGWATFEGPLTGTGYIEKTGSESSSVVFHSGQPNSHSGTLFWVKSGKVTLVAPGGSVVTGPLLVGGGTAPATINVRGSNQFSPSSDVTLLTDSRLRIYPNWSAEIGSLEMTEALVTMDAGSSLTVAGNVVAPPGAAVASTIEGPLNFAPGATRIIDVAESGPDLDLIVGGLASSGTVDLEKTGAGTLALSVVAPIGSYSGTFTITDGRVLTNQGIGLDGGTLVIDSGAALEIAGGGIESNGLSVLAGGTVAMSGGILDTGHIVAPTGTLQFDGGTLRTSYVDHPFLRLAGTTTLFPLPGTPCEIEGDLNMDPNSRLVVEMGPGQNEVEVFGTAFLDGTLDLLMIDGYVPEIGDEFLIIAGDIWDGFSTVLIPDFPDIEIEIQYLQTGVLAVVVAETSGADVATVDHSFGLAPNFPNPFTSSTSFSFSLSQTAHVSVDIFDLEGRRVRSLADETRELGHHHLQWNGLDDRGRKASAGTYFVRLQAGGREANQRITMIR